MKVSERTLLSWARQFGDDAEKYEAADCARAVAAFALMKKLKPLVARYRRARNRSMLSALLDYVPGAAGRLLITRAMLDIELANGKQEIG